MRPIDPALKARILQAQQTLYKNADPRMEILALRPTTAIRREQFWQESIVTAGATATCTSIAIRRQGSRADRAYVAYVADGVLTVKSAAIVIPSSRMTWVTETTIEGCQACALEFEGHFRHIGQNVEFRTDALPYLFYVTTGGALLGGLLGGPYESLAGSGVTAVDAINGVSNTFDAQDQGFFVFYIAEGAVYYNTYLDGTWEGQRPVSIAPANAVAVKAERTFDYRIVLHVQDATGAVWEVFGKMEATGWNSTDYISLGASIHGEMVDVHYSDFQNTEHISLSAQIGYPYPSIIAVYSPVLMGAHNIATATEDPENPGTFYDDYGYRVIFQFDQYLPNAAQYPANFRLRDALGNSWYGQTAVVDYETVTVAFTDFNNAVNPVTATALAGNLWNGLTMLSETSKTFEAAGLVPTFVPAPVPINAYSKDAQTIIVDFDMPIISIDSQSGFTVSGFEPSWSPEGNLVATNYEISLIDLTPEAEENVNASLADAVLVNAVIGGGITLAEATS